jgi:acetyl-CoA C-acetyltransferase
MAEAFIDDAVRTPRGRGTKTGALHSGKPIGLTAILLERTVPAGSLRAAVGA